MIIRNTIGKYMVMVSIQDGEENCGEYNTEEEAIEVFFESQKFLNGWSQNECDSYKVYIYEYQPVTEYKLVRIK